MANVMFKHLEGAHIYFFCFVCCCFFLVKSVVISRGRKPSLMKWKMLLVKLIFMTGKGCTCVKSLNASVVFLAFHSLFRAWGNRPNNVLVDRFSQRDSKTFLFCSYADSNTGTLLFTAPKGRTMQEFMVESRAHGWPSFRDPEVRAFFGFLSVIYYFLFFLLVSI